jgi:hypothetical protein
MKTEWVGVLRPARFAGERGLFPVDAHAIAGMQAIGKTGSHVLVSTRTARNLRQFRLYWALCSKIAESFEPQRDKYDVDHLLKIKGRHFRWVTDPVTGELTPRTESIAVESMTQEAFALFFQRCVEIICAEIVPGMDAELLKAEVLEMIGGDLGKRAARGGRGDPDE